MSNKEHCEKIKTYLKENKMTQTSLANIIHVPPSQLSSFLNNKNCSFNTEYAIKQFLERLEVIKNKEDNFIKYGFRISIRDIKNIKKLYFKIKESLNININSAKIRIHDENWNEDCETIKYFLKHNIDIKIDNYRKRGGLFSDSDEHVDIYLTWSKDINVRKLDEDVNMLELD